MSLTRKPLPWWLNWLRSDGRLVYKTGSWKLGKYLCAHLFIYLLFKEEAAIHELLHLTDTECHNSSITWSVLIIGNGLQINRQSMSIRIGKRTFSQRKKTKKKKRLSIMPAVQFLGHRLVHFAERTQTGTDRCHKTRIKRDHHSFVVFIGYPELLWKLRGKHWSIMALFHSDQ